MLNFLSVIWYCGYRQNMGSRGKISQHLQLTQMFQENSKIHTTDKHGKLLTISELGQKVCKCSLYYSFGFSCAFENFAN